VRSGETEVSPDYFPAERHRMESSKNIIGSAVPAFVVTGFVAGRVDVRTWPDAASSGACRCAST
jgi:hypothetical protein